jgi:four helix bundle protein
MMQVKRAIYKSPGQAGQCGFEDLECYKLALDVVVNAHELANHLPPEEKYDLATQIRRSAKSVTANIAEGYGRYHYLDSLCHYSIARGELNETLAHFANALVLANIGQEYYYEIYTLIRKTEATHNGFMNYVRKQRAGAAEFSERQIREEIENYEVDQD